MLSHLVGGVLKDVTDDSIGRRAAMVRLSDAIDRVSEIDDGVLDEDVLSSVSRVVSSAFDEAGLKSVSGAELREALEAWRRDGAPAALVGTPHAVARLAAASRTVMGVMAALSDVPDIEMHVMADGSPREGMETGLPPRGARIHLLVSPGEESVSGIQTLCGVISGPRSAEFLDLLTEATPESVQATTGATFRDPARATRALRRAASALATFNLAAHLVSQGDRLGIQLNLVGGLPDVTVRWDGCLVPAEAVKAGGRQPCKAEPDVFSGLESRLFEQGEAPTEPAYQPRMG